LISNLNKQEVSPNIAPLESPKATELIKLASKTDIPSSNSKYGAVK
jgi:hypothetical protein